MSLEFGSTLEKNQARGLKACISNPRVSEAAKHNAQQKLDGIQKSYQVSAEVDGDGDKKNCDLHVRIQDPPATVIPGYSSGQSNALDEIEVAITQGKKEENVVRGYKAVLKNPRASDEAREHAGHVLESHALS